MCANTNKYSILIYTVYIYRHIMCGNTNYRLPIQADDISRYPKMLHSLQRHPFFVHSWGRYLRIIPKGALQSQVMITAELQTREPPQWQPRMPPPHHDAPRMAIVVPIFGPQIVHKQRWPLESDVQLLHLGNVVAIFRACGRIYCKFTVPCLRMQLPSSPRSQSGHRTEVNEKKCDFRIYLYIPTSVPLVAFASPAAWSQSGTDEFQ